MEEERVFDESARPRPSAERARRSARLGAELQRVRASGGGVSESLKVEEGTF